MNKTSLLLLSVFCSNILVAMEAKKPRKDNIFSLWNADCEATLEKYMAASPSSSRVAGPMIPTEEPPQKKTLFHEQCKDLVLLSIEATTRAEVSDLEKLNLSNKGIKKFKKYVENTILLRQALQGDFFDSYKERVTKKFTMHLKTLNLSGNKIRKLPKAIAELQRLTSLDVSHNNLKKLPANISELSELKQLNISHNNDLTQLPNSITKLPRLVTLCLGKYFDGDHCMMPTDVHCCGLQLLPDGIENLPKLDRDSKRDVLTLKAKFARQKKYLAIKENKENPVWMETYKTQLTTEQKDAINAENYPKNPEKARKVIKLMIEKVFESLTKEEKKGLDVHECASYFISLREAVLSDKPILVTDIPTARARAIQRLTPEGKATLSRVNFLENRDKAHDTVLLYADYFIEELYKIKMLPENSVEYKTQAINDKMKELDDAYSELVK